MKRFFEDIFLRKYKSIESELTLDKRLQTLISVSALVSMGSHDFLQSYLQYALAETLDLEEVQEVILQSYLFAGFPAAIEGFIVLKTVQSSEFQSLRKKTENNLELWKSRGKDLFDKVYAEHSEKVLQNMTALNPDLAEWMLIEGYGKTLSRTGLKPVTREFCAIAGLAANGWERQVYSHCKGAINCGAKVEDIRSVLLLTELFKPKILEKYSYILDRII